VRKIQGALLRAAEMSPLRGFARLGIEFRGLAPPG